MTEATLPVYEIAGRQIVVLAILVLYLGYFLKAKVGFVRQHHIPVSVAGGLVFSILAAGLAGFGVAQLTFDLEIRNFLLLVFFSTIGLNAKLRELAAGGKALMILVTACVVLLVLQNAVGVTVATLFGKEAVFGLFGGSISLAGGHGTTIAWGNVMAERGVTGVSEFGIAAATFGLILGGLLGGPVAGRLIEKRGLKSRDDATSDAVKALAGSVEVPDKRYVSVEDLLGTILALALCLGIGDAVNRYLFEYEIRLPGFLTAMMAGVIITNLADISKLRINHQAIDLTGGISLQLFLVMSLMSMDLLSLADSIGLLIVTMVVQTAVVVFFAIQVVFRVMGRDYDAAMITGGFMGLGLGATPVAIASMDVVAKKHGPSVKALLVVPLVGAFFIDLVNAATIEIFLRLPFMQ